MVERVEADKPEQRPLKGEKQYRDFLLQSLGVTSLLIALLVCWAASLPTFLAEELSLTAEEVEAFAIPGARLMAKSDIPDRARTAIVNSGDYIGLGTAALMYIYRVLDTMKTFKESTVNGSSGPAKNIPTFGTNAGPGNGSYTATVNHAGSLAGWGNFTAGD